MENVFFGAHLSDNEENECITNGSCCVPKRWYDKIPSFLIFYFSRFSTLFYIIIFILQISINASLDIRVTIVPLIVSFLTSLVIYLIGNNRKKHFIEKINDNKVFVLRSSKWIVKKWKEIKAGDIIKLTNNNLAPADLVILFTSNGKPISVKTHIIDGRTQLGPRLPPNLLDLAFETTIKNLSFTISDMKRDLAYDPSQANIQVTSLYNFTANLNFNGKTCELTNKNFVERYSAIFHNGYVICGVVYTGNDCKVINNTPYRTKFSKLEKKLNLFNIFCVALILIFSFVASLVSLTYYKGSISVPLIHEFDNIEITFPTKMQYFGRIFLNYVVLLLPISPLELYPFLDFILVASTFYLMKKMKKSSFQNISSVDEMTHINSVVTSKSMLLEHTPTLKRIFLNGKTYGKDITTKKLSENIENDFLQNRTILRSFFDPSLTANEETKMFFLHLSLCHAASIVGNGEEFTYVSRFPDDIQLLRLAANSGFMLTGRTENDSYVHINKETYHFKTKRIIHSSIRHPRISIIVEDSEGTLILLTRGVYKVMINFVDNLEKDYQYLYDMYHAEGLHVECITYKYLTPNVYHSFEEKLAEFGDENVDFQFSVIEELEKHSTFLSLFAFEDKPRNGALLFLARAKSAFDNIILSSRSKGTSLVITSIALGIVKDEPVYGTIQGNIIEDVDISISYMLEIPSYDILIISGSSIEFLEKSEYASQVANVIKNTKLIILQRCDQLQTSQFIEYLQRTFNHTVMAVGHSIYDSVYMSHANVSVAVNAEEIQPCSVSSDIVVNSFNSLCDIIFVEGVWIRERIRSFINFIIPRNMFFAFMQFWYGLFCCFSGTPLFRESDILSLLLFFTAAPFISRSLINEKFNELKVLSSTTLFKEDDISNFTVLHTLFNTIIPFIGSLVLVILSGFTLQNVKSPFADTISISQFSQTLMTAFTFGCVGYAIPKFDTWNGIHHFVLWGSQILFLTIYRVATQFDMSGQSKGTVAKVFTTWPSIALMCFVVICFLFLSALFSIQKKSQNENDEVESEEKTSESNSENIV